MRQLFLSEIIFRNFLPLLDIANLYVSERNSSVTFLVHSVLHLLELSFLLRRHFVPHEIEQGELGDAC